MPKRKKSRKLSKPDAGSHISFKNSSANNNGRNGVSIGYGITHISFDRFQADGNGGDGIAIQGPEKDAVLLTLRELSKELEKTDNTDSLKVLVTECEQEVKKPGTNMSRLTSIIQTVKSVSASAIEFAPKISTAIDSVISAINSLKDTQP